MEAYTANSSAGNSAPFGGRRGSRGKKLRMVKKKTVRKMLKKLGMKMRGGASMGAVPMTPTQAAGVDAVAKGPVVPTAGGEEPEEVAPAAGRRRRSHKKTHRRSHKRSLFGMRY